MSANPAADLYLRALPFLDEKWLRADLICSLRHQSDTATLWNHLIQDCELVSSSAAPVRNAAGNLSYLGDDGKHYCGVQKLTCLCCPASYCGPLTACNCNACRTLDSDAAIKKLTSAAQTAAAQHLTSDAIFQSWLWGNCPTTTAKRSSQRTLLHELHDISLQAAGSCLSSLQLRQQLCIYERYFVALVRCSQQQRMRLAQPAEVEAEESVETPVEEQLDTSKAQSNLLNNKRRKEDAEADGKHVNPAHTLAQVGTRAALNFSFAFLRRAWRSGEDTELCSELLGEALESLHDLPAASLFNPSEVSELWIEVLERSMKFLRQVALGDPISGRFVAPRRDRNLSLCLLLELCVQKGTLPAMLEAVLLLLTIWAKEKSPNDNRDVPQTVSAQLVPILKRFAQLSSVTQDKQHLSATQSFLRYLTLPDSEKSYVDIKHAAVVLMSFLDRMSAPYMPVQHNLYTQQQQQQKQQQPTMNKAATTTKPNDASTQPAEETPNNNEKVEEQQKSALQEQRIYALGWSSLNSYQHGFTAQPAVNLTGASLPQYAAPVLNLNFQVEQVAFSEEYVLFLRDNCNLYMWPIADPQAEPIFMQQFGLKSVAAHCEGKHFLALHYFGMVYSWGNGENGRLGHGDTLPVEQPEIVYGLNHVKSVHCGCSFSAAITDDGSLYTWGRGTYGRLGHGTSDDKLEPTKVAALEKYEVVDVALSSGDAHMLCVTSEGLVFAWGDGDFGKLGNDTLNGSQLPVLIETLPRIKRVFAGSQFSVALSQEGKLYTWGKVSGGRLGHADYATNQTSVNKPQLVEALQSKNIVHVSVGVCHCLALSSTGEVFGWGRNDNQQICPPSISREPILRTPILVTPSSMVAHGVSCGAAQSIIWSQTCIQNVPVRAPFVIELTESTFYLLDQLLNAVCAANDTARQPPNQERECITIACLNLLKLQFHALLNNDINASAVGLIQRQKLLSSLKTRVLALAGGGQVLKTIQDAAQQTLQVGWSILLPTAAERAQTLTALLPAEAGGSTAGHKFMTDLLVSSLMAEDGLETALMQLINPELQQQDQSQALPFLQLIRQLLRNISTMTQVQLMRLLLKSGVKLKKCLGKAYQSINATEKAKSKPSLLASDVGNPSLDLLHRFQRLLLSHLHQSKPEEIGGAEGFLSDYLTVMLKYCTQVMRKAYEVAVRGTEGVTDILHADISDTLLYELIIGLILLKRDRVHMLGNFEWNKHFLPLLKALDAFNRLICDSDIQDADDMGWPGIISRGNSQKPAAYDEFMRIVDVQNQVLEGQKLIILNGFVCDINEYQSDIPLVNELLQNGIGKDLSEHMKIPVYRHCLNVIYNHFKIGRIIPSLIEEKLPMHNSKHLTHLRTERALGHLLGMVVNLLQNGTGLQPAELQCKSILDKRLLSGGLQIFKPTNPFEEEKTEARSCCSTTVNTPTDTHKPLPLLNYKTLTGSMPAMQYSNNVQQRIDSFINGLAEARLTDALIVTWITLTERYYKENNMILHQQFPVEHPVQELERLLAAALIRHQSLGGLVLNMLERELAGIGLTKPPKAVSEMIRLIYQAKWALVKQRQQLNRSYKEVCAPMLERLKFLLFELRPAISLEQEGLRKLPILHMEPRFKRTVRNMMLEMKAMKKQMQCLKKQDILNVSIQQQTHAPEAHKLSHEQLLEAADKQYILYAQQEQDLEEAQKSGLQLSNNYLQKLCEKWYFSGEFNMALMQEIVEFVLQDCCDVETVRRAMFCQVQRYEMRLSGLKMLHELLQIPNLLDAVQYNIYNGYLGLHLKGAQKHPLGYALTDVNFVCAYQKVSLLLSQARLLEWAVKELQRLVNQEQPWRVKEAINAKHSSNFDTYVFVKKMSRARFLLSTFAILAKDLEAHELSLLVNGGILGTVLGLLRQTGGNFLAVRHSCEMTIVYEDTILKQKSSRASLSGKELAKLMKVGTRIVRGADWKWGDQDGTPPGEGRIISEVGEDGWVRVEWYTGATNSYRMGKEGKYDLRLADSSLNIASPDADVEKDESNYEVPPNSESHPTKLLRYACTRLLQIIAVGIGLHCDKMDDNAVRGLASMFRAILDNRLMLTNVPTTEYWTIFGFLRAVSADAPKLAAYLTTPSWIDFYMELLEQPVVREQDVYRKVHCLRLLETLFMHWNTESLIERMSTLVPQLFALLGKLTLFCPYDYSLQQCGSHLPKPRVLLTCSHSSTVAEEIVSLLKKLHNQTHWNSVINSYLSEKLCVAAEIFGDCDNGLDEEHEYVHVMGALCTIGGCDPRPRISLQVMHEGTTSKICGFSAKGKALLYLENTSMTEDQRKISLKTVNENAEHAVFNLNRLPLNEILLNAWAVLLFGPGERKECVPNAIDISLLRAQQLQLAVLNGNCVLYRHQTALRKILKQRAPQSCFYSPDESLSEDDDGKVNLPQLNTQELLVQSLLVRATQPSPLKASYGYDELITAALNCTQLLASKVHAQFNEATSGQACANQAPPVTTTMVHGEPLYNLSACNEAANLKHVANLNNKCTAQLLTQLAEMGFPSKQVELVIKKLVKQREHIPTPEQVVQHVLELEQQARVHSELETEIDTQEGLDSSVEAATVTPIKFKSRKEFQCEDLYAMYVRGLLQAHMMVRCCQAFEAIKKGDTGIVLNVVKGGLHALNVEVDWKQLGSIYWVAFKHVELLEMPRRSSGTVEAPTRLRAGSSQLAAPVNELDLIDDWSLCLRALSVSSNESTAKHLLDGSANYWQSFDSVKHWIRLEMHDNILIHKLSIVVSAADHHFMPSLVVTRVGDHADDLHEYSWMSIKPTDTVVTLMNDVPQYYACVEIVIKQCRNYGIQTRVHNLQIIGRRKQTDLDLMLMNGGFLACELDSQEQTLGADNTLLNEPLCTVMVWGLNDKEQMGGLKGSKIKVPTFSQTISRLRPIHIAGGSKSLFIVSQDGKLYACGEGTNGRLGLGVTSNVSTPRQLPVLHQYVVKKVSVHSGGKHAMALTLDGKVFSWGEGEDGKLGHGNRLTLDKPKMIEALRSKKIRDIACGSSHSAAITSSGELYTWGLGEYGRLGHGDNSTQLKPKLVQALLGKRVLQVACGSRDAQTLALTEDGAVYSWGDGDFGKLGRGGSEGSAIPHEVERLTGIGVIQIECGAQFSLALTRAGEVWTWGKGDYYRLGHGNDSHVRKPQPVQGLRGKKIIHVAVGALHCLAVSDQGQVFAWGDNDHGQQGSGNTAVNKKPALVIGLDAVFANRVACGSSHSVAWGLPQGAFEDDKKGPLPFTCSKDPLGGCSLGIYDSEPKTSSIGAQSQTTPVSLSAAILCLETMGAKQTALNYVLNAMSILQARQLIIAALTSHSQIQNNQEFEANESLCLKPASQTNQLNLAEVIAQGGGEALAEPLENTTQEAAAESTPLSTFQSLTGSLSLSGSVSSTAAPHKHTKMSSSAMSVIAATMNNQQEFVEETSLTGLDDFTSLLGEQEAKSLIELLKLSVAGRTGGLHTAQIIADTLIALGSNSPSIGQMLLETCITELEDLCTSRFTLSRVPKPVMQESTHPYADNVSLSGQVKIPGAEALRLEFDSQCSTEKRNDPLVIMDSSDRVLAMRSGREFAQWAPEIRIPGDEMRWKFTSDSSVNGWGWRFWVHAIMPPAAANERGSDRAILSQPSMLLVMHLLHERLWPHQQSILLRLAAALAACAQLGCLSTTQRIWALKKLHALLLTKYAPQPLHATLTHILMPLIPELQRQYEYEEPQVRGGIHLMHSDYFKTLAALACDMQLDTVLPANEAHKWTWFKRYCIAVRVSQALIKRTALPTSFCLEVRKKINEMLPSGSAASSSLQNYMDLDAVQMLHENHNAFKSEHDGQLLQWLNRRPDDWAMTWGGASTIYGWGHNHRGQLGGLEGSRIKTPTPCEALSLLRPLQLAGGEQTLFAVTPDGKLFATGYGSGGRLGVGGTDSWSIPTLISTLQHVFVKKVAVNSGGKHCLALTSEGDVYSWGEGEDGKLGHGNRMSYERPKLIEDLSGIGVVDIGCGSAHSAAITATGHVLTWGKGRYGRLGHGDSEDQLRPKLVEALMGYRAVDIACGSGDAQTLCITDDDNVWSWGDGDYGKLGRGGSDGCKVPHKIESLSGLGVIKVECGSQFSVALTKSGAVYTWGKGDFHRLGHGTADHIRRPKRVAALQGKKVISIATGSLHCVACTDMGEVYTWGDNDEGQLGDGTITAIQRPRIVAALQGKHIVKVTCGSAHTLALSTTQMTDRTRPPPNPPLEYDLVRDLPPTALHARLVLLHHFSELVCPSLAMLPITGELSLGALKDVLVYSIKEAAFRKVIQTTMVRDKQHGPVIELNRIQVKRSRNKSSNGLAGVDGMKSVFGQMVQKLPLLTQEALSLPHRVWKVKFVGESVDDCGGGYSESIAEMCDELQNGSVPLLIPTPNGRGEAGANRDCFLLDPTLTSILQMNMFRFLGVLMGIAVRTGSPLSLNLAEPVWRQLAGEELRPCDLTEVDRDYVAGLVCIRNMDDDPKMFHTLELPFSTSSAKGHEVSLSTRYGRISTQNRQEYVRLALNFRLHEFDEQVNAVRDGMSKVVPVPLLSLFSATELQAMVCGSPDIPLGLLKSVATYKGYDQNSPLVNWFWEVMEEFSNQERSLFLRFVWGRTRLPRTIADFRGRDFVLQVLEKNPPDHFLPESYTCFFLLKMPRYSCKAILMEKLKYAIHFCKSIDTDEYARVAMGDPTEATGSEDDSDIESTGSHDD